jgi:hypothetical protein
MLSFGVECATDIAPLRALLIAAFGGIATARIKTVGAGSPKYNCSQFKYL